MMCPTLTLNQIVATTVITKQSVNLLTSVLSRSHWCDRLLCFQALGRRLLNTDVNNQGSATLGEDTCWPSVAAVLQLPASARTLIALQVTCRMRLWCHPQQQLSMDATANPSTMPTGATAQVTRGSFLL